MTLITAIHERVAAALLDIEAVVFTPHAPITFKSGIQSPAARALGRIGGVDSLGALLRYLHSREIEALADTVDSLARIGDDAAVLPLVYLFDGTMGQDRSDRWLQTGQYAL